MLLWARLCCWEQLNSPRNIAGAKENHYLMFSKRFQGSLSGDSFLKKAKQLNSSHTHTHTHTLSSFSQSSFSFFCHFMHWHLTGRAFTEPKDSWKFRVLSPISSAKLIFSVQCQCDFAHRSYLWAAAIHQLPSNCPLLYKVTFLGVYRLMSVFFLFSPWQMTVLAHIVDFLLTTGSWWCDILL